MTTNEKPAAPATETATESAVKVWTKSGIQALVADKDQAAIRALMVVYANQTASEKAVGATTDNNGVGFTGLDAEILTSFAKFYARTGFLSVKQMTMLKKKITKYWKQLLKAAEAKGAVVCYNPSK